MRALCGVMIDGLHIVHTTIADFINSVSVNFFVKFVVKWKLFVNQAEKIESFVGFDTLTERRAKYQMVLRYLFLRGCSGVFFM